MAEHRVDRAAHAAREHVALRWDEPRIEVLLARTRARARRRKLARTSLAALAAAAVMALGGATWSWFPLVGAREAPAHVHGAAPVPSEPSVIRLADGSIVTPLDASAEVVVMRVSDEEILLELRRGAARFDVVPGLERSFVVAAGEVRVAVVGTIFEMHRAGEGARVRVLEGRVRVTWPPDGEALLRAGGDEHFPRAARPTRGRVEAREPAPSAPPPSAAPATSGAADGPVTVLASDAPRPRRAREVPARRATPLETPSVATRAWIEQAERGEYEVASRLLADDPHAMESTDLDVLLLASDTLRLTGRPERALAFLDHAATVARGDPRAPVVAFTRGRLLLTALARPGEAAEAFAAARALEPDGSLAMDAHAREVEALARGGDAAARERAEEYVRLHPNGLQIDAVRRWGGLPPP